MKVVFSCSVKKFGKYKNLYVWNKECSLERFKECWINWIRNDKFNWVNVMLLDDKNKVVDEYVWYDKVGWKKIS